MAVITADGYTDFNTSEVELAFTIPMLVTISLETEAAYIAGTGATTPPPFNINPPYRRPLRVVQ